MAWLSNLRIATVVFLLIISIFLIHPYNKEGLILSNVRYPASLVLKNGDFLVSINGVSVSTLSDFDSVTSEIGSNESVSVEVLRETYPYIYKEILHKYITENKEPFVGFYVREAPFSNIKFSHEFIGGNKFYIKTDDENAEYIIKRRLEIMNFEDYDLEKTGDGFILTTAYGNEIKDILGRVGKFEAKVGDELFFTAKDIEHICMRVY